MVLPLSKDNRSTSKILARVPSSICCLGEESRVGEGRELPRGGR